MKITNIMYSTPDGMKNSNCYMLIHPKWYSLHVSKEDGLYLRQSQVD